MGGKRVKKQSLMNRKPFNYIAIKIALYLAIFIAQANAQVLPKEFNIKEDDIVLGNVNSEVVVIEYYAPTCGPCANADRNIFPVIKEKYIDTGKIAYVMREFVGNKQDLDASILARCSVDNEGYLKLMEVILSTQEDWAYNKNYRQYLVDIGAQGGITEEQYKKCLADDSWTEVFIKNAKLAANTTNFIGTPSFFINGELISVTLSKEQFFLKIDQTYSEMALKTACPECEEVMTYLENITREINNMARG